MELGSRAPEQPVLEYAFWAGLELDAVRFSQRRMQLVEVIPG